MSIKCFVYLLTAVVFSGMYTSNLLFSSQSSRVAWGQAFYANGVYSYESADKNKPLISRDQLITSLHYLDETDFIYFPSRIVYTPSLVNVELKDNGGTLNTLPQGQPYIIATYSNKPIFGGIGFNRVESISPYPVDALAEFTQLQPGKPLEIWGGAMFGDIALAVRAHYATANFDNELNKVSGDAWRGGLDLGGSFFLGVGTLDVTLAYQTAKTSLKKDVSGTEKQAQYSQGGLYTLRSRYHYPIQSKLILRPYVQMTYGSPSYGDQVTVNEILNSYSQKGYGVGFGLDYQPQKSTNLLAGVDSLWEVNQTKLKKPNVSSLTFTAQVVAINLALLQEVVNWASLLVGVNFEPWGTQKLTIDGKDSVINRTAIRPTDFFSLGTRLTLENLTVDALMGEQLLYNGPYLITGKSSNWVGLLSIVYRY